MHLHIDCQFGLAGDMLLAALIDAGANQDVIADTLKSIPLRDFRLSGKRTSRNGVAAMLVDVDDLSGARRRGKHTHDHDHDHHHHEHGHDHGHDHDHGHNHDHAHDHDHDHDHNHDHAHAHDHAHPHGDEARGGPHRHLGDLLALLDAETISTRVRERAGRVFRVLAQAEASVHGQPVDKVHFHEISGIDTAVDIIGSCIALDLLEVDSISASAPSVGSGMIMCEHGIFPVPAPATLEILKSHNIPWRSGGEGERATPTGIALLAGLAESFGDAPEITVARIGYGAGHREYADVPNLLRVIVGKRGIGHAARPASHTIIAGAEPEPTGEVIKVEERKAYLPAEIAALLPAGSAPEGDRVVEFRFAVDDMTAENLAFMCEKCLSAGALEAYALPATMKKGRAGHEVVVLASPDLAALVADVIWNESTTFGMRVGERSRLVLPRDFRQVVVLGHTIRIKLGWRNGAVVRRQPEYEDCRAAALATGKPLAEIFALAAREAGEL